MFRVGSAVPSAGLLLWATLSKAAAMWPIAFLLLGLAFCSCRRSIASYILYGRRYSPDGSLCFCAKVSGTFARFPWRWTQKNEHAFAPFLAEMYEAQVFQPNRENGVANESAIE